VRSIFDGFTIHDSTADIWSARQHLFEEPDALILKVSVLPDDVCPLISELLQSGSGAAAIRIVAQATGSMTASVAAAPEIALGLLNRLRERVDPSGGSVVVLRAPAPGKENIDVWGPDRGTWPLMREIKRKFDPNRILNPGRFVGGI